MSKHRNTIESGLKPHLDTENFLDGVIANLCVSGLP